MCFARRVLCRQNKCHINNQGVLSCQQDEIGWPSLHWFLPPDVHVRVLDIKLKDSKTIQNAKQLLISKHSTWSFLDHRFWTNSMGSAFWFSRFSVSWPGFFILSSININFLFLLLASFHPERNGSPDLAVGQNKPKVPFWGWIPQECQSILKIVWGV